MPRSSSIHRQRRTDFLGIVGMVLIRPEDLILSRQRRTDFSGIVGVRSRSTVLSPFNWPSTQDGFLRYCGECCIHTRQRRTDFSGVVGLNQGSVKPAQSYPVNVGRIS